ncbi:MAG: hydrolase 1, exosortase A system-associated [Propionivibrio sp.]|nr:hydrolase 1, exosortase A system-associated [Propionivibrio sp.]
MNYVEQAVLFSVGSEQLLGIVATPDTPIDCGVLIVVGGPQYRVGSHRQFLLLTRRLAAEAYPTMRFDYRGMGDSDGAMRSFEEVADDIGAAIDTFQRSCPSIRRVVLWGLCDAASSALLYAQATGDSRVAGLVLLNPWVRSEASLAQTHIKHYYGQRLLQREFWFKLLSGKLSLMQSVRGLVSSALKARGTSDNVESKSRSFQDRMAEGLRQFSGRVLLILSGEDFTAKEFLEYAGANAAWSGLLDTDRISRVELPDADHTFSAQALRSHVEDATLDWLASLER